MMKCSTKEITVQVFGKTAKKNGLNSIYVISNFHQHSPVVYSIRGYTVYVLLNEISK